MVNISFGFWSHARNFLASATAVKMPIRTKHINDFDSLLPAYYLVGHAIELALKSFLLAKGHELSELRSRKYGHDLEALLSEARRRIRERS